MATTSSHSVAGKAITGQGDNGNDGRRGRRAALAAGVVALGCAAALTLGGLRAGDGGWPRSAAGPAVSISQPSGYSQQQFLERNIQLPSGGTLSPPGVDRQRFLDWNTQFPTGGMPDLFVPDQFTYREDHRSNIVPASGGPESGTPDSNDK